MRKLTLDDVEWNVEATPEDLQIEGDASAIGPDADRETAEWIRGQLDSGNVWAWCSVRVIGRWEGLEEDDCLGACSYTSQRDFEEGGYYDDMRATILERLQEQAEHIARSID